MKKDSVHTIADIARLAQVSKSTVSRALNDSPLIGEETKERIRAIAREHNFRLNAPARRLSLQQSRTIAYVTHCYDKDFTLSDLFSLEILGGITTGLYAQDYDLLMANVDPHRTDWVHQYLDSGRVDGFIVMTAARKHSHVRALIEKGAPFIVWAPPTAGPNYCSVSGDNLTGGWLAARHLVQSSRQRIAFLGGPANELEVQQRFTGYQKALAEGGQAFDPALVAHGDYSTVSGTQAVRKLLEQAPDLDAIFANSDLMAIAAMNEIRETGRRVPEDIAVVGYDDLSIAEHCYPRLTTIRQNVPLAGKILADNLIQYLQTGIVTQVSLPVELVVRQSA